MPGAYRCALHDVVPGPLCPSGCAPQFVKFDRSADPRRSPWHLSVGHEAERQRLAYRQGCRSAPGNTPTIERLLRKELDVGPDEVQIELDSNWQWPNLIERRRNRKGRFLPEAHDPPHPDELKTEVEVMAGLRKLWFQAPDGSRSALARAFGFKTRQQLAALVKGLAFLPHAVCRRCSRVLAQMERGELTLEQSGLHPNGTRKFSWKIAA